MANLINAFTLFGRELLDGSVSSTVLFLMLIEVGILAIVLIALLVVVLRKLMASRSDKVKEEYVSQPLKERTLVGITLDTQSVKRHYNVGEELDYDGLLVTAVYGDGSEEQIEDYIVEKPILDMEGSVPVTVKYQDQVAEFNVYVVRPRAVVGIALDTEAVKVSYAANEEFTSEGLLVTAKYSDGIDEIVTNYTMDIPSTAEPGVHTVNVRYEGFTAYYTISVAEPEPEKETAATVPLIIDEESYEAGILRYDRSFTARLIQSDDDTKNWYTEIKNKLLSYKKIKDRMSWKKETYRFGKAKIAKLGYRGKVLCLFLALDPADYVDTKYKVEDVSENSSFSDTPVMYRIKNDRRAKYALQLIETLMEKIGAQKIDRISQDYYLPYEGVVELIDKGLIKRNIKSSASEAIFKRNGEEYNPAESENSEDAGEENN